MKKRFTEGQIVGFLREADAGVAVKDLCRKHGFSEASYYLWRSKFGGMSVSDAKRLKELASSTDEELPKDAILMQLGKAYQTKGNQEEARKAFSQIIDEHPTSPYSAEAKAELGS